MTERFANIADRLAKLAFRSNTWKEVTATVQSSAYHPAHLFNLASGDKGDKKFFEIAFSYTEDGERYTDKYKRSDPLDVGHEIVILYNPLKPDENNLSGTESTAGHRIASWIMALYSPEF